jgi:hypothetical protein
MKRLNPDKLHVNYLAGATPDELIVPRCYTLTHSDITGELFLSISGEFNKQQISRLYTRLMRDEALVELSQDVDNLVFRVYCHVSGGFVVGTAKWRYNIFKSELPLVLESIRYGDRFIFEQKPKLDTIPVVIHFISKNTRFNKVEDWGTMSEYK